MSATEGLDLQGRGKYEAAEGIKVSNTPWLLLSKSVGASPGVACDLTGTTTTTVDY